MAGTALAVNYLGTRTQNLKYELVRGNIDYIRTCEENAKQFINTYQVGYPPQNSVNSNNTPPPTFFTRGVDFSACKDGPVSNGELSDSVDYWQYFGRDRALGAADWKLIIPLGNGYNNEWLLNDGVSSNERAILEDIDIFMRYRNLTRETN